MPHKVLTKYLDSSVHYKLLFSPMLIFNMITILTSDGIHKHSFYNFNLPLFHLNEFIIYINNKDPYKHKHLNF
jgi:hypothetical protein